MVHDAFLMPSIRLSELSKVFENGVCALDKINLAVRDGEFMAIVGPSGCGKSTLLRILAGLDDATAGCVLIDEKEVNEVEPKDRNIGMVFQNYALFPHLSVFENIAFGLQTQKLQRCEIKQRVESVAARLNITALLDRKPDQLSGGQRQRVALGRLLAKNPSIHLLDEPLSNLDAHLRNSMRTELKNIHREDGKTTLFVTHDQIEAMILGQRIAVMRDGKIEQVGTPREIYDRPANQFVASFFGAPPINLMPGEIKFSEGLGSQFIHQDLSLTIPPSLDFGNRSQVVLGIRAEDLSPYPADHPESKESARGEIAWVDDLGESKILHIRTGRSLLALKTSLAFEATASRSVGFVLNWEKAHWFDPQNGERINSS